MRGDNSQLQSLENCGGVVDEAFFVCHNSDCLCVLLDCLFGILDDAHALEEVVDATHASQQAMAEQFLKQSALRLVLNWLIAISLAA